MEGAWGGVWLPIRSADWRSWSGSGSALGVAGVSHNMMPPSGAVLNTRKGGLVISPAAYARLSIPAPWRPNPAPWTHPTHPGTSLGVKVALRGRGFGVLARAVALCGRQRRSQGGFGAGWGRRGGHTGQSRWVNGCGHIPQVHWGGGAPQRVSPWRVGGSVVACRLRGAKKDFYFGAYVSDRQRGRARERGLLRSLGKLLP